MASIGYIQVHAYSSYAQLPLSNVAISVTTPDGTAIALRLTNSSGQITPIEIPVPEAAFSQAPNPSERPFTAVNLYAHLKGYEQIEAENLQVFADTVTLQNLEMIPLAELPQSINQIVIYDTPAQNL